MQTTDLERSHPSAPRTRGAKELLLRAAAELFSKYGRDGVSVREIAEAAGVGHAGVNYHFGSKALLYTEVLRQHRPPGVDSEVLQLVGEAVRSGDPSRAHAAFQTWVTDMMQGIAAAPDPIVNGLVHHELARPEGPSDEIFDNVIEPNHRALEGLFALLNPALTETELRIAANAVVGQCLYYRFARHAALRLLGAPELDPALVQSITDQIVRTTLEGLSRPPTPRPPD